MCKRVSLFNGKPNLLKLTLVALVLFGLIGVVPYFAQTQDRADAVRTQLMGMSNDPLIGITSSTKNPLQIAILHWYSANQTASFGTGNSPRGVAFDGSSIWVANTGDGTVTKLQASD